MMISSESNEVLESMLCLEEFAGKSARRLALHGLKSAVRIAQERERAEKRARSDLMIKVLTAEN